ncbi:MAG: CocE/NonD family hydrolase [Geminicoccaceae bacterium]
MSESQTTKPVREIENEFIELGDGTRLAARIWLPEDAYIQPVPAILEYLPYRKRDGTATRDALTHPWFAARGYACIRVDMRGSGESDGFLHDEYLRQEQDDALEVIAWLRDQPWCTGRIGMMGISWGGFNGLQVAARAPEGLDAVVTLCSTVDRYADDVHYKGGCILLENLGWSATMLSYMSRPPDPELVGGRWKRMWLERLAAQPHLAELWHEHQQRDDYWKHGSICEDYSAIKAAVLAIGGWGDSYKNAVPAMLEHLTHVPCKGIIGPWVHKYPHFAVPGPRIGFLQEALRWWDRWLKDIKNDVEQEPAYRVYCQTGGRPQVQYEHRAGRWLAERQWPSPNVNTQRIPFGPGGLDNDTSVDGEVVIASPQDVGSMAGEYCAIWLGPDLPGDQRSDDAFSVTFDGQPVEEETVILGAPSLVLRLSSDRPQAHIAVRLNAINPDGSVERITYGVLNLSQRESAEKPESMRVGEAADIRIALDHCCHSLQPGQRLRVAISNAYWPLVWPDPQPVTLRLAPAHSWLELPLRTAADEPEPVFAEAVTAEPLALAHHRAPRHERRIVRSLTSGVTTMEIFDDFGEDEDPTHGLIAGHIAREIYSIHPDDPTSASARMHWSQTLCREAWNVRTEAVCEMRCDRDKWYIEAEVEAFEDGQSLYAKSWRTSIPRRFA